MGGQKVCTLTLEVAAIGDSAPIMELLGLVLATLVGTLRSRQRLLIEDLFLGQQLQAALHCQRRSRLRSRDMFRPRCIR